MAQDPAAAGGTASDCEVMASEDGESLVIAAICRDEAWLSMPMRATVPLAEWR